MWTCGIDWAEKHLDLCLQNPSGDVTSRQRVDNNEEGFHAIMALFADKNIDEVGVAIESPHEPVVDFLLSRGISVYPVNPNAIDQYRKSLKVSEIRFPCDRNLVNLGFRIAKMEPISRV